MTFKLKILHFITNSCHHPYLYNVVDYTNKEEFEISVGSLSSAGELQKYFQTQNIETFSLNADNRSLLPKAVINLARWLRKNRIDIIQTHLYDAGLVGLFAAKLARTPVRIFTGHHSHEMQFYKGKPTFYGECLMSRYLANHIIAPTEQMKEIFIKYEKVPAEKIAVVHHGFDLSHWKSLKTGRDRIRKEFNLEGKIIFGAVGKIFWIKDYPLLFKSFAPIAKKYPDAALMIVGTGDETNLRRLASELGIEKQIIFTGWRNDVANLFTAMDVFVHSALAESFGLVIIEAMAMGKPIICTDVGIAREIISDGENGFLVPTNDTENFTAAIKKMIQIRSQWDEIGKTNRSLAQEFTAAKMAAGYEACYIKWSKEHKK